MEHKSQLAKLLATENISFRHDPTAVTAYFDIKNRNLVLPVWQNISNDLYDMLLVHETGHAIDTPMDKWKAAIEKLAKKFYGENASQEAKQSIKDFINVVEDARIDKRQKRRYPGARRNYVIGYKELIDRDFFGTSSRDINDMSFIDRVNMFFKGGHLLGIKFSNEERPFVRKIENSETFDEVVDIVEELYQWVKDNHEKSLEEMRTSGDHDYDFDGSGDGEDVDAEGDEDDLFDDFASPPTHTYGVGRSGGYIQNFPECKTERHWQQNMSSITATSKTPYLYADVPSLVTEDIMDDYKVVMKDIARSFNVGDKEYNYMISPQAKLALDESFLTFRKNENATVSFMVKEFEMRKAADINTRTSIAKTGVIDTNKLHSYQYNEDLFRRMNVVAEGKSHGFIMFLDWSGSMCSDLKHTMKQLFSLTFFCKRVQIPFEVYLFRDTHHSRDKNHGKQIFSGKKGEINIPDRFRIRNILSSRMSTVEMNEMYHYLWYMSHGYGATSEPMSRTPLNSTILSAAPLVEKFRKNSGVQIVNTIFLTDGESNTTGPVLGVSVGASSIYTTQAKVFIRDNVCKKEYAVKEGDTHSVTNIFLKILKDRTQCNLIGFFLHNGSSRYILDRFSDGDAVARNEKGKKFEKEGFIGVTSGGYDEYYIVNPVKLDLDNTFDAQSSMTKRKIATIFKTFVMKKAVNRILLQKFVKRIAEDTKKVS